MTHLDTAIMRVAENIRDYFDDNNVWERGNDEKHDIIYDVIGDYTNSIPLVKLLLIAAEDTSIITKHERDVMDEGQTVEYILRTCLFMYIMDNINLEDFING